MSGFSTTEVLFYGGLGIMAAAVVLGAVAVVFFRITGKRIRRRLEKEYGNSYSVIKGN